MSSTRGPTETTRGPHKRAKQFYALLRARKEGSFVTGGHSVHEATLRGNPSSLLIRCYGAKPPSGAPTLQLNPQSRYNTSSNSTVYATEVSYQAEAMPDSFNGGTFSSGPVSPAARLRLHLVLSFLHVPSAPTAGTPHYTQSFPSNPTPGFEPVT